MGGKRLRGSAGDWSQREERCVGGPVRLRISSSVLRNLSCSVVPVLILYSRNVGHRLEGLSLLLDSLSISLVLDPVCFTKG